MEQTLNHLADGAGGHPSRVVDAGPVAHGSAVRARVFRNLTRRCMSVQIRHRGAWVTFGHATSGSLKNVAFNVNESGRRRTIASGKKQVHAWMEGELEWWCGKPAPERHDDALCRLHRDREEPAQDGERVGHNPFRDQTFVRTTNGRPVMAAASVSFSSPGVVIATGIGAPERPGASTARHRQH